MDNILFYIIKTNLTLTILFIVYWFFTKGWISLLRKVRIYTHLCGIFAVHLKAPPRPKVINSDSSSENAADK